MFRPGTRASRPIHVLLNTAQTAPNKNAPQLKPCRAAGMVESRPLPLSFTAADPDVPFKRLPSGCPQRGQLIACELTEVLQAGQGTNFIFAMNLIIAAIGAASSQNKKD